jgi:transposase
LKHHGEEQKPDEKEPEMSSRAEISAARTKVLNERVTHLAVETGFITRVRNVDGADGAHRLIVGWVQEPDLSLEGRCQVLGRRDVDLSAPGLFQRVTPEASECFRHVLEAVSAHHLRAEEAGPTTGLQPFQAVMLEDRSIVRVPQERSVIWKGCGGHPGVSDGAVTLSVRWDVLRGHLDGPRLTDARCTDRTSPFQPSEIPAGALSLADVGFCGLPRLQRVMRRQGRAKGSGITRLVHRTHLSLRNGHLLELRGVLPRKGGDAREMGVLGGTTARVPMRLILVRVPNKVGNQRRTHLTEDATEQGREPSEDLLYLADWTIFLTTVPRRMLSLPEVVVMARLRWHSERLFRLWKEQGKIDDWRSEKPSRMLAELSAKLCAMVIQPWLLHHGCWDDPHRSVFQAAQVVRREVHRLMVALVDGGIEATMTSILHLVHHCGGHLTRRNAHPGTDQLVLEGLDWPIPVFTSCVWKPMSMHPHSIPALPEETARGARAILPHGNVYLQMRDEFGTLSQEEDFRDVFPRRGQPAEAPWRLAFVTLMHDAEGLTDRPAADAVRTRIDWTYVFSLELTESGCDFSVLSEFRGRLLAHGAERRLFDRLLEQCRERGWIKARGKQRTDSTHVLAAIRTRRRLECVGETMRHALTVLADVAPPGFWSTWTLSGLTGMKTASVMSASPKMSKRG